MTTALPEAEKLRSEEKFQQALDLLEPAGIWDSLYPSALTERCLSQLELKRFSEAEKTAEERMRVDPWSSESYELMAVVYFRSERTAEALKVVEDGLKLFPYNSFLNLKKFVYLKDLGRKDEAWSVLKTHFDFDPFNPLMHWQIFDFCKGENLPSQALMSGFLAVVFEGDPDVARSRLGQLDQYAAHPGSLSKSGALIEPQDRFLEIDELLRSRVALNREYRYSFSFDYPLFRQLSLLVEQMGQQDLGTGFFAKEYAPFYKNELRDSKTLDLFMIWSMWSFEFKGAAKVEKTLQKNSEVISGLNEKWRVAHEMFQPIDTALGPQKLYLVNNRFSMYVPSVGSSESVYCRKFSLSGGFEAEGSMRDNLWTGTWKFVHPNGQKASERMFYLDTLNGDYTEYHFNGNVSFKGRMKQGLLEGEALYYYEHGQLKERSVLSKGVFQGESEFYRSSGALWYSMKPEGAGAKSQVKIYSESEKLLEEGWTDQGKRVGLWKVYFPNGMLASEVYYLDGLYQGLFRDYHAHGSLRLEGEYKNGIREGVWTTYDAQGTVVFTEVYRKGSPDGVSEAIDPITQRKVRYSYKQSRLKKAVYIDELGTEKDIAVVSTDEVYWRWAPWSRENWVAEGRSKSSRAEGVWSYFDY